MIPVPAGRRNTSPVPTRRHGDASGERIICTVNEIIPSITVIIVTTDVRLCRVNDERQITSLIDGCRVEQRAIGGNRNEIQ